MRFSENDAVRVTAAVSGTDSYTGDAESVPAGHVGTIVVATEGVHSYEVDFTIEDTDGDAHTAVLSIDESVLEPLR